MDTDRHAVLFRGMLEFLVLAVIGAGDVYAGEILERLDGTDFATREGTLYPLLGRLRREGLLDHAWQESNAGPPRKYYRLTEAGRAQLAAFRTYWTSVSTLVDQLGA